MSTMMNDSMDTAKDLMSSAKQGTEHAVESTRATIFDGLRAAASVLSILRGFGLGDALGWVGLRRRHSPGSAIAVFGAGVAVGAGLGILFAPTSGSDTRSSILGLVGGLKADARRAAHKVEEGGAEIRAKVDEMAGQVKDAAIKAEHKVERTVTGRGEVIGDRTDAHKTVGNGKGEPART